MWAEAPSVDATTSQIDFGAGWRFHKSGDKSAAEGDAFLAS